MNETQERDPQLRLQEQSVRATLAPLTLVMGAVFAILPPLAMTPLYNPRVDLSPAYVVTAVLFFVMGIWWLWRPPGPGYPVHLLGGVVSWLTLIVVLLLALDPHPREVPFQHILVLAAGVVLLSHPWFLGNLMVIHASYVVAILRSDMFDEWRSSVPIVTVTLGASIALHIGRHVSHRRLTQLTLESESRRQEAERSMAALSRETEQRNRLQEELLQAQKLESLGRLAGGVAHDFNNLLVPMMGNAELLLLKMDKDDEKRSRVEDIATAGERAALLTQQLLAYAGRGVMKAVPVDLTGEIREIARLVTSSLPKNTRLALDVERPLPAVKADRGQLHQILANLILNAGEASAERGGTVTVRTGTEELDAGEAQSLSPSGERPAGTYIFLQVADQGKGMDEDTLARMYDPFFSTKSEGRGLGLTAVLGIARRHGGGLRVRSRPGEGTEFTIFFPQAQEARREPLAADDKPPSFLQGRVLLVDDEEAIRRIARCHLEELGLEVAEAPDGLSALSRVRNQGDFDVVVLDMRMPGMSGEETFHALREIQPELPILISSGYEREVAIGQLREEWGVAFLAKPYRLDGLTRCIEELLKKRPGGDYPARQEAL